MGAPSAATQLESIDAATMLGDMDPKTQIEGLITQISGIYSQVTSSHELISSYQT